MTIRPAMHPDTAAWHALLRKREAEKGIPVDFDAFLTLPEIARATVAMLVRSGLRPSRILDPGAGPGIWGKVCRDAWPEALIGGIDLRDLPAPPAYDRWFSPEDFLLWTPNTFGPRPYFDLVVGNPPFGLVEPFVHRCLEWVAPDGLVVLFLRLAFLAGQDRAKTVWNGATPFRHHAVLSRRPSFTGDGNSDPRTEYMIGIWEPGYREAPTLSWLDWSPDDNGTAPKSPRRRKTAESAPQSESAQSKPDPDRVRAIVEEAERELRAEEPHVWAVP